MNLPTLIVTVVLTGLLIALAILQVLQALYEKYFFSSLTNKVRDYLKAFIPGAVWHEQSDSKNPRLSLSTGAFSVPCRMVFCPGFLEKDAPRSHDLRISIKANYPTRFSIYKRSLLPSELFLSLCMNIGYFFGRFEDKRLKSGNRAFDFWHRTSADEHSEFIDLLRCHDFQLAVKRILKGRVKAFIYQNDELILSYQFKRYSERPSKELTRALIEEMDGLQKLPKWTAAKAKISLKDRAYI